MSTATANGSSASLSEAMTKVIGQIGKRLAFAPAGGMYSDFPVSHQWSCVVCKMPRINGDVTGLTCGDPDCLAQLGVIVRDAQIDEEHFAEVDKERENLRKEISEMMKLLGLKLPLIEEDDNLLAMAEAVRREVERIAGSFEELKGLCAK